MTKRPPGRQLLLQGNEAIVEGALAAGCRFFAGYPITPATEISEVMSYRLPAVDGTFIQMEDEIASLGAVIGASLAGVKSMTATSGPGLFSYAGKPRFCLHCRGPVRNRERHARRSKHGAAHQSQPGRRDAGAVGNSWRPPDNRSGRIHDPGLLLYYSAGIQPVGKIPHPGDRVGR